MMTSTGMRRQVFPHQPVEHDGAGDDAAVHGGVLVREGEVIVDPLHKRRGLFVADGTARARLLRAGIECLEHRLRYAGERDFFVHNVTSAVLS